MSRWSPRSCPSARTLQLDLDLRRGLDQREGGPDVYRHEQRHRGHEEQRSRSPVRADPGHLGVPDLPVRAKKGKNEMNDRVRISVALGFLALAGQLPRRPSRSYDPHGRQHPVVSRPVRRQPLVHRRRWQQDRPDHDGRRLSPSSPSPPPSSLPGRYRGRPGRQPLVHRSFQQHRSGGSPRPASSPSSRFPRPTAFPSVSQPARTATSGSPS